MGGNGRCFELIGHEPGMNPSGKDAILKERKTTPKSSKNVRLWDLVGKKLENEVLQQVLLTEFDFLFNILVHI